jgi:hypothetical protein
MEAIEEVENESNSYQREISPTCGPRCVGIVLPSPSDAAYAAIDLFATVEIRREQIPGPGVEPNQVGCRGLRFTRGAGFRARKTSSAYDGQSSGSTAGASCANCRSPRYAA